MRGGVGLDVYQPSLRDAGHAPHIAFFISHRTGNNFNNTACQE
jgi:hypothetical protein